MNFTAIYIMWYRQIKRILRAKSRIVGAIFQPIIWMIFFGTGWAAAFKIPAARMIFGGLDYLTFLAPGIIMMAVFFTSFMSGISVIWDRQFGFLKEVLVAPAPRWAIILGRILGDSTLAILQGLILTAIAYILAPNLNIIGIPLSVLAMLLTALTLTSIGIIIGSKMSSMEGFQLITTFFSMPMLFLSGAFYPVETMPQWMKTLAHLDPLTYGVDLTRNALTGTSYHPIWINLTALTTITIITLTVAATIFKKVTIE